MRRATLFALVAALAGSPVLADDPELTRLNQIVFNAIDKNGDGQLSRREVDHFREDVMISQDSNSDGDVSRDEYMFWDMGWRALAEKRGALAEYNAARAEVFDAWDVNGDGILNLQEQELSQAIDFYQAAERSNMPIEPDAFQNGLRIMAAMNAAVALDDADEAASENVVLINVFEVPEGEIEAAIAMWEASRDFLQTQPGYVSTALHQSISPDAKFQLINVAEWESPAAFQAATKAMRETAGIAPVDGLSFIPGLYSVVAED